MKKMNNKGFSLVELIVVVLIMAIIAVALAPQVMKWVENSRKATDCNNYDSVVSAASVAMSNEAAMTEIFNTTPAAGACLIWSSAINGTTTANGNTWFVGAPSGTTGAAKTMTVFNSGLEGVLGSGWTSDVKVKRTKDFTGKTPSGADATGAWRINIDENGILTRTSAPSSKDIS